jgi:hypothetical protein
MVSGADSLELEEEAEDQENHTHRGTFTILFSPFLLTINISLKTCA